MKSGVIRIAVVMALVAGASWWLFARGPRVATVNGKVTLDGAPLAGAQLAFLNEQRAALVAQSNDEGTYQLFGNKGAGIPVGKYQVVVTKMTLKDGTVPRGEALEQARANGLLRNV